MKKIALIPARYAATRFPGKLMQRLGGKTVILRTYEATVNTGLFDDVAVVCDSEIIGNEINKNGGKAIISEKEHECGTDRIAEVISYFPDAELVVNVQGDEPFTQTEPLRQLLHVFEGKDGAGIQVASLMQEFHDIDLVVNPNFVKVAVDLDNNALFFSRSPIPYHRDKNAPIVYYKHIGIYAFRRQALLDLTRLPVSPLEAVEKIECLRYLEHGIKMKMVTTQHIGMGIDTPEDLAKAEQLIAGGK